jgi:hypothetical protein
MDVDESSLQSAVIDRSRLTPGRHRLLGGLARFLPPAGACSTAMAVALFRAAAICR